MVGEWINPDNMIFFSAKKKWAIKSWKDDFFFLSKETLRALLLAERRQAEKAT